MGEYEPDDSRKVTLTDNRAPGEPPRTGPREGEARARAQVDSTSQTGRQSQSQGGQSQSQSQSPFLDQGGGQDSSGDAAPADQTWRTETGDPDRQTMQSEPGGSLAGNQPQAADEPTGASELSHDQYELNQPRTMHNPRSDADRVVREQAAMQGEDIQGFGYGADGDAEMADAPDASDEAAKDAAELRRRRDGDDSPGEDYLRR
jgi:hypothetical protein